jgi:hypothetical protein
MLLRTKSCVHLHRKKFPIISRHTYLNHFNPGQATNKLLLLNYLGKKGAINAYLQTAERLA